MAVESSQQLFLFHYMLYTFNVIVLRGWCRVSICVNVHEYIFVVMLFPECSSVL